MEIYDIGFMILMRVYNYDLCNLENVLLVGLYSE